MYDVIIIGGGVAGCIAAYCLGVEGVKVLILEKEPLPRYKTCGGGIVLRAAMLIPFEIDLVIDRKIYAADIFDHDNHLHFHVERYKPIINMTMRENLDYYLLAKAVGNDAKFKDKILVTDLIIKDNEVEVITNKDKYFAKYVICADGATGISTKVLGLRNNYIKVPAIEHEVFVPEDLFNKFSNSARFDFGFLSHGYGWVFPKKKHLSIGLGNMYDDKANLNDYLKAYLKKLEITDIIKVEKHGYFIPIQPKKKKFTFGRILLAGDAAGLADPLTAEGISYAIETGIHAADSILEGKMNVDEVADRYNKKIKKLIGELKNSRFLSYFVYSLPSIRKFVFKKYGRGLSELMTDIFMGELSYSKLVKNPLNYIRFIKPRNFMKQPVSEGF
ncbi:putative oxidoreductase [bacterium BMS3Abin03]|nr:putative oxidoreductase [bacterium BMS3Abin03]